MTETPRGPDFGDASETVDPSGTTAAPAAEAPQAPDFGDAPEFAAPATDSRAPWSPDGDASPADAGDGPDFADYQDAPVAAAPTAHEAKDPAEAFEPPAAGPAPRPARPDASVTGRMRAIVGGITILAILAIGLAVFLPKEKSEKQPQAGMQTTQSPTPSPLPTPAQQYQQQAASQDQQSDLWARQAHQEFLQRTAQAKAQSQNQGAGRGQAITGNSGGNDSASNADGGTGYKTCPDCGGEGSKPCPMKHLPQPDANGLYHMLNPYFAAEPRYYSGSDPLLPEDADMGVCPYCGGKGKVPCGNCGGHGQVPDTPTTTAPGSQPGGSTVVDGAIIDSVARQLMGAGGQ